MKKVLVFSFFALLLSQPFILNQTVSAHNEIWPYDPVGPGPTIKVTVIIDSVELDRSMDDGQLLASVIDEESAADAEMVLGYAFDHDGHTQVYGAQEYDHNFSYISSYPENVSPLAPVPNAMAVWSTNPIHEFEPPLKVYEHIECEPMANFAFYFRVIESDQSTANTVAGVLLSAASALAVTGVLTPEAGALASIAGLFTSIAGLNEDDDLGFRIGQTSLVGQQNPVVIQGDDATATIHWRILAEEIPNGECWYSAPEGSSSLSLENATKTSGLLEESQTSEQAFAIKEVVDNASTLVKITPSSKMESGTGKISETDFKQMKNDTPKNVIGNLDELFEFYLQQKAIKELDKSAILRSEASNLAQQGKYQDAIHTYQKAFFTGIGYEQKKSIPAWIKNNAEWWSAGKISDKDFAIGIEYMIKNGIIPGYDVGTSTTTGISSDVSIPDWIKNNALWWSRNEISDGDFLTGIDFMIGEKILDIGKQIIKDNSYVKNGVQITTQPDGTKISKHPNGTITIEYPDGTSETKHLDGSMTIRYPDGTANILHTDGTKTIITTLSDGTVVTERPDSTRITVYPDGRIIEEYMGNLVSTTITTDEGATKTTYFDKVITKYPDGKIVVEYFSGKVETTYPDGTVETTSNAYSTPQTSGEKSWFTSVLLINNVPYPAYQFTKNNPDVCTEEHYHIASGSTVYSLTLQPLSHPNNPCGFGTTKNISYDNRYVISESQALAWGEMFDGLDIREGPYIP